MATLIEAGASPGTANQWVTLYTVPAGKRAILTLSMCNTTGAAMTAKAAKTASPASPDVAAHIECNAPVLVGPPVERTGILLGAGKSLAVQASAVGMAFQTWGLLEDDV